MSFGKLVFYELKLHYRSLLFWVGLALTLLMVYTEIIAPLRSLPQWVQMATENPHMFRSSSRYLEIAKTGLTEEYFQMMAGTLGDRLAIVLSLVAVFIGGFVFIRDQRAYNQEISYATVTSAHRLILAKYFSLVIAFIVMIVIGMLLSVAQFSVTSGLLGGSYSWAMVLRPLVVLVLPTIMYVTALVMTLAVVINRPTAVVPIYFLYFFLSFMPKTTEEGAVEFPLNLGTFVIRYEGHQMSLFAEKLPLVVTNRLLYLGLTIILLVIAGLVYHYRRTNYSEKVAI